MYHKRGLCLIALLVAACSEQPTGPVEVQRKGTVEMARQADGSILVTDLARNISVRVGAGGKLDRAAIQRQAMMATDDGEFGNDGGAGGESCCQAERIEYALAYGAYVLALGEMGAACLTLQAWACVAAWNQVGLMAGVLEYAKWKYQQCDLQLFLKRLCQYKSTLNG